MNDVVPALLTVLVVLSLPVMALGSTPGGLQTDGASDAEKTSEAFGSSTELRGSADTGIFATGNHVLSGHGWIELEDTVNRLDLVGDRTGDIATPTRDVGSALVSTDNSIRTDYHVYVLEERFEELDETERIDAIEAALDRVENRMDRIEQRERAVVRAHADGETSTATLLQMVAENHQEATELRETISVLDERGSEVANVSVPAREYTAELDLYTSPVRAETHRIIEGTDTTSDVGTVSVQTSSDGFVLATTDQHDYVREVTRFDNRDRASSDQFESISEARETAQDLYPWAFDRTGGISINKYEEINLYRMEVGPHDHGTLQLFFDGGTANVFQERQVLAVDQLPMDEETIWSQDGVNVTLEQTVGNGPALVTVTDSADGNAIEGAVAIDGTTVGTTSENGKLWIVPAASTYELSVSTGDQTIQMDVAA